MVVERDDDKRKDLAWEDRLAADGYSCVALFTLLSPPDCIISSFCYVSLFLSVCLSRMEWKWHGSFIVVVKWR